MKSPPLESRAAAGTEAPAATNSETQKQDTSQTPKSKPQTTLGFSLFVDPLAGPGTISEIRQRLEIKTAACTVTGGFNGYPLDVDRIKDSRLRAIVAAGMVFGDRGWGKQDLMNYTDHLEGHAGSVLMATLDDPAWGPEDLILMDLIERVESMRSLALGGGRML
jgi:hypothetical protein